MPVSEAQRIGFAAVLLISFSVYGISLLQARQPVLGTILSWGSQGPLLVAVEVSGDPGNDGIYFLPDGLTLKNVLCLIGIQEKNHDRKINPAKIISGSILTVSPKGEVTIGEMAAIKKLALGLPLDLNRLSEEELSLVPGIGEKTASQIIQLRREMGGFKHLEDLMALPGIKEKKLNTLEGYLMVR